MTVRSTLCRVGGIVLAGALAVSLAACAGSSSPEGSTGSAALTPATVDFQLSWLHSVEWGGTYLAEENGYFADQALTVNLLPGGPSTAAVPVVVSGKATIGVSTANAIAAAVAEGADLKIIGAEYQRSPWAIISAAAAPLTTPADIIGKRIGVSASSEPAWNAFLALNHIDPSQVTKVPLGFDLAPLIAGEVDGALGYDAEAPVTLAAKGFAAYSMPFADFGFNVVSHSYFVTSETLASQRDVLERFLTAQIQGLQAFLADSDPAADLAVSKYASDLGLNLDAQRKQGERQKALISTAETDKNGLLYVTPAMVDLNLASFTAMGISANAGLFDMSLLDEVYSAHPDLR
jgi:ABC-type nitrate/sulfonate/bicarbonate transport system substrate-binding protein